MATENEEWVKLSWEPLPKQKRHESHSPRMIGKSKRSSVSISWPVCTRCGLIYLKNKTTEQAIRRGCFYYDED
jgi:hypothetical protein